MPTIDPQAVKKYITLANLISLARAFMAIPIVVLLNRWDGNLVSFPLWAVFWIVLAIFSDYLDGWAARSYHEVSWIGKILDPIADKIVIFSVLIFARPIVERIPWWFLWFTITREVLIATLGLWVTRNSKRDLQANPAGKWSVFLTAITFILIIFKLDPWSSYLLYTTVTIGTISLLLYLRLYYRIYRENTH